MQDSGPVQSHRDISVESRLLNTEKFLEKHLMDNLMWYAILILIWWFMSINFLIASEEILSQEIWHWPSLKQWIRKARLWWVKRKVWLTVWETLDVYFRISRLEDENASLWHCHPLWSGIWFSGSPQRRHHILQLHIQYSQEQSYQGQTDDTISLKRFLFGISSQGLPSEGGPEWELLCCGVGVSSQSAQHLPDGVTQGRHPLRTRSEDSEGPNCKYFNARWSLGLS